MEGLGNRLRNRARQLGLSDAEVARRAGLATTRYGHYVTDYNEPDLATLLRICRVLGMGPDELLGYVPPSQGQDAEAALRADLIRHAETLDATVLEVAATVMRALAGLRHASGTTAPPRKQKSATRTRRTPAAT